MSLSGIRRLDTLMRSALLFCCLFILVSCSYFNETRFENSLGKDVNLVKYSNRIADDLLRSAFPPLLPRHPDMPILTTTFVDNNDLEQTSHFGRLLQDNISARFVQSGYTVKEIKLRNDLIIEERSGETMLTREQHLLPSSQAAQAILVGTVSHVQRTMYISARLVNPHDQTIIASKTYRLYMDRNVLAMFNLQTQGNKELVQPPKEPLMNRVLY